MKKICLLIFIFSAVCTAAQNKPQVISMQGLGSLKLGMSLGDVEKLLKSELVVTKNYLDTLYGSYDDTAIATFENIPLQLEFHRSYNISSKHEMRLTGIRSNSSLCKTVSGIGVGSDKLKIISDFDNYYVKIQQGYVNYFDTEEGKGKTTISVSDGEILTEGSDFYTMVFYLLNKKVISFELKAKLNVGW